MSHSYKTQPYEHQRVALRKGATQSVFGFFMEQGTGKTKVTIDNAVYLYNMELLDTVYVIAPNSVYTNWKKEIEIHSSANNYIYQHKIDKKFYPKKDKLNWYLMNIEAFSHKSGYNKGLELVERKGLTTMMVIDESTTIKNRTAKRSKNVLKLGKGVRYRRILTGTPVTKSPLDLWSQFAFLDEDLLGFKSFYTFRAHYCIMESRPVAGNRRIEFPVNYINLEQLEEKILPYTHRVLKKDCLDLPPQIWQRRNIFLSNEQRNAYEILKEHARVVIQDKQSSIHNKLTEIAKLQQVCSGFLYSDDGKLVELSNAKLDELLNIIEEIEGKIIIWATFRHSIQKIAETLQKKYGEKSVATLYGDTKKRSEVVDNFNDPRGSRFLVSNPSVGGYGLTLNASSYQIFFNNSYNLEERLQAEARNHRSGQKADKVTYIDLVAVKTIDEFIIKALKEKITISAKTLGEEVLDFLK
jgi:SNF2 family DNA or RNA helicase